MVHLGPALLVNRLVPPRLPPHSVSRERLLRSLDAALHHRLTLISAAAGWGKTILLSAWAASRSQPTIWVTLDERDNHTTRFWIALYTAIQLQIPDVGALALARLHSSEPLAPSTVLAGLLDDLATASPVSPLVIILDDYHAISDPALHEGIALLVEHLPLHVHLVVATRVDPDLPLARWRVQGLMHELRSADLRFTLPETHALFTHTLGDGLTDDDAQRLAQRTEGWAAALQVVALALRHQADRHQFVRAFTGSHRLLLDYMHEEVLAQQPPELQRFLLHTSIVRALNAALCAALTGDSTSQSRLEWLVRRNLFLTPLDDERRWYRVHDLFREVLLVRLRSTEPESLPRLHLRAAHWYAEQGELRDAIAHAFDADDSAYAAELIERAAPSLWLHGEAATVHAWMHALPDATFWQHARLALDTALRLPDTLRPTDLAAFTDVQIKVEQTLARVEAGLRSPQEVALVEEATLLRRRIQLLRAMLDVRPLIRQADIPGLRRLAEAAASLAEHEEVRWEVSALSCMFWLAFTFRQEEPRLIPRLLLVKERAIRAGDHTTTLATTVFLAHMYRAANQLRLQAQECREGIERARQLRVETAAVGNLQLTLAEACYAENRLDAAADALNQGLHNVRAWGHHDLYLWGLSQRAQLELARHDIAAAAQALQQAEETVQRERFPHWEPTIDATRAQLLLAGGDHVGVDRWLAQTELDPQTLTPNQDVLVLTKARLLIARQRYGQALETLERFTPQFDRPGHLPATIAFLALLLVALDHRGRQEQVREVAVRLFTLSEPADNLRVFLDIGTPMAQLVARFAGAPDDEHGSLGPRLAAFCARLLAAFGDAQQIPAPSPPRLPVGHQPALAPPSSPEPLTQREQDVLRLLAAGASNQEIADQLVISLATAKKHVSNILAKLGVTSRAQAIARVRDLAERS